MTDNQKRALHALAFGNQHEMALRLGLSIGPEAVKYALDRIMVYQYLEWIGRAWNLDVQMSDSFLSRPFEKVAQKSRQPEVKAYFRRKILHWGLSKQVKL